MAERMEIPIAHVTAYDKFDAVGAQGLLKRLEGFTEGPWRVEEFGTGCDYEEHITYGSGGLAKTVTGRLGIDCGDEDARVMAAAPDLHKHLTAALAYIVACEETIGPDYIDGAIVPTSLLSRILSLRARAAADAREADKYRSLWGSECSAKFIERTGVADSFAKLRKERDALAQLAESRDTRLAAAEGQAAAAMEEVRALRAEMDTRIAAAVADERRTIGTWVRAPSIGGDAQSRDFIARSIERGDHAAINKPVEGS